MTQSSPSPLERQLILETTLFQEETTPEAVASLLDQLETEPVPFSPDQEWARFRQAHPAHFPPGPRRAVRWVAAACLALAAALPTAILLPREPAAPADNTQTPETRAVLYRLAGASAPAAVRAELPFDGTLIEGPSLLPPDAQIYVLPFPLDEDPSALEDPLQGTETEGGATFPIHVEPSP